jgi:hypothetical protein
MPRGVKRPVKRRCTAHMNTRVQKNLMQQKFSEKLFSSSILHICFLAFYCFINQLE